MKNKYNQAAERLYEKLLFHREKFDTDSINLKKPFPMDQLEPQTELHKLIKEVQDEVEYDMSEFQCSWAVVAAFKADFTIDEYNKTNNTELKPRA